MAVPDTPPRHIPATLAGAFTTAQAHAAGWSDAAIAREVRHGRWRAIGKGVLVEQDRWAAMAAPDQHLCLAQGRLLVLRPGWFVARRSAVIAHGLPYLGPIPSRPQLVRDATGVGKGSSRHERVGSLPAEDQRRHGELFVTSLERTVLDVARAESFRSAVVVADAALRQGMSRESMLVCARRGTGWPGAARAGRVVAFADGLSESPLESVSRVGLADCGLPPPELQVEIYLGGLLLGRVDKLWRAWNLVGEDDGRGKYVTVDDLYAEKLRQERLQAVGLEVVRWDWATAWRPRGQLDVRVRRGMELGSRQALDPRVRFVPTTVEQARRRRAA